MDETLIHLPLFRIDGENKFWCEIFGSLVKYSCGLHFAPSASGADMKFCFYVVDDTRNAYAKFVRSGVK